MSGEPYESFTVRLPRKMAQEFTALADRDRRSKNGQAIVAIRAMLDDDKRRRENRG